MDQQAFYAQVVGQVIRGARELQRVNLVTMATAAELSSSGWSRIETGDTTMTLAHLRKASRRLGVQPWTLIRQADHIAVELARSGVSVHDDRPRNVGNILMGGAAILAIVAGAAALTSKSTKE